MEAKIKAREIYDKMCYILMIDGGCMHEEAIKCVIVLIDEQIKECIDGFSYTDYRRNYWIQVKIELQNINQ